MNLLYKDIKEEESYKNKALKYRNKRRRNKSVEIKILKYFFFFKIVIAAYIRRAFNIKSFKSSFSFIIINPLIILI
jgi:hypothetical protein